MLKDIPCEADRGDSEPGGGDADLMDANKGTTKSDLGVLECNVEIPQKFAAICTDGLSLSALATKKSHLFAIFCLSPS